jgi:large conductance mechanosensitive channel
MKGFRDFVLRGNLIELAVAFIIGAAFATVIGAFTKLILEAIGKATGGADFNFDDWQPGGWSTVGPFLTALIAFLIMAFVVYFFIVKPYEKAKDRYFPAEPDAETIDPNTELLREIRDALRTPRA